ncbi:MAG: hypothetical protein ABWK53_11715 [Anaerolineales bacterium]
MKRLLLLVVLCLPLLSACLPLPQPASPWQPADLRALDPAGDAPTPASDLLAVYTRLTAQEIQIRIDLLDLAAAGGYDLRLRLWDSARFASAPLEIHFAAGSPTVIAQPGHPAPAIRPRLVYDPALDTVVLSLSRALLTSPYRLDLFSRAASSEVADSITGVRSDALPPSQRAAVLLAFWDAFPAATPAQALRRWDGAHTGPTGERHGLRYLLEAAGRCRLPVFLLDLKTPASLAILNAFQGLDLIAALQADGLLILPDVVNGQPAETALAYNRRAARTFRLPASDFVYAADGSLVPGYRAQFLALPDASHLSRRGALRLIPLPPAEALQATADGPALDLRRALMDAALSSDLADLVVLGGSLPHSTWGDADMAAPSLAWLAAHPWIDVLDGPALLTFPLGEPQTIPAPLPAAADPFLAELQAAPSNALTDAAWQVHFMLVGSPSQLRTAYQGQIGVLLAGSAWAARPYERASCADDPDRDGQPECVLASLEYFAVFELEGARLTHLFYRDQDGAHQLIGPTAQFLLGMSDSSLWNPAAGQAADPGQVMGAFSDRDRTFEPYEALLMDENTLRFSTADGQRLKTFRLAADGLTAEIEAGASPLQTSLPLVVDPGEFFFGGREYAGLLAADAWEWGPRQGLRLEVRASARLWAQGYPSALLFLSRPENPDLDYPPIHYLPFPLALVRLSGQTPFEVHLEARK